MTIQTVSKQEGFQSSTNTKLGRQLVKIIIDGKEVAVLTGDELHDQLYEQGYEIIEIKNS